MSAEDLERYEADIELQLYKEYKDVSPMFSYVVETERRFYLANEVIQTVRDDGGRTYVELELRDAWVWDMYRTSRFVQRVRIVTFKDVNVEELPSKERVVDRAAPAPAGPAVAGSGSAPVASSWSRTGTGPGATGSSPATGDAGTARSTWSCGRRPASWCSARSRPARRRGSASPAEAVTPAKQQRLRRLALAFLAAHADAVAGRRGLRFDVASVIDGPRRGHRGGLLRSSVRRGGAGRLSRAAPRPRARRTPAAHPPPSGCRRGSGVAGGRG